jgi:hypothetical protein
MERSSTRCKQTSNGLEILVQKISEHSLIHGVCQAAAAQLESLAGEWQAYHDAEVATLREQLASAQGDAEGASASLREQLQRATSVRCSPHKLLPYLLALHAACC